LAGGHSDGHIYLWAIPVASLLTSNDELDSKQGADKEKTVVACCVVRAHPRGVRSLIPFDNGRRLLVSCSSQYISIWEFDPKDNDNTVTVSTLTNPQEQVHPRQVLTYNFKGAVRLAVMDVSWNRRMIVAGSCSAIEARPIDPSTMLLQDPILLEDPKKTTKKTNKTKIGALMASYGKIVSGGSQLTLWDIERSTHSHSSSIRPQRSFVTSLLAI